MEGVLVYLIAFLGGGESRYKGAILGVGLNFVFEGRECAYTLSMTDKNCQFFVGAGRNL